MNRYRMTLFYTNSFCYSNCLWSLSKTINTKIRNKIINLSVNCLLEIYICEKFNRLYTKSMNDNKIDNDEYNGLVKVYEDYKKNKKNKLSVFLN